MKQSGRGDFWKYLDQDFGLEADQSDEENRGARGETVNMRYSTPSTSRDDVEALSRRIRSMEVSSGRGSLQNSSMNAEASSEIELSLPVPTVGRGSGRAEFINYLIDYVNNCEAKETKPRTEEQFENSPSQGGKDKEMTYFTRRDTTGTSGQPLILAVNYLKLFVDPLKPIYKYAVSFDPPIESIGAKLRYLKEHPAALGETISFDGFSLLLPRLLQTKKTVLFSEEPDNSITQIQIMLVEKLKGSKSTQFYNILFDRIMKILNFVRFGRRKFDPTLPKIIPHEKLEVWPGYVMSVDEFDGGLMLCCDVAQKLLCQKTVYDFLTETYASDRKNFQNNARLALIDSVIITRYNNKNYRIDDIDFDSSPMSTFTLNNQEITYAEYYRTYYNIEIRDLKQPLLISVKKVRRPDTNKLFEMKYCLVPEIANLTGLQDYMRSDFKLMRELASITAVSPNQRMYALRKFHRNVNESEDARKILENWGLSLDKNFLQAKGRQLAQEQVCFATKTFGVGDDVNFTKHTLNETVLEAVDLHCWLLIHTRRDTRAARVFIEQMEQNVRNLGIEITRPRVVAVNNDIARGIITALRANLTESTQIVVIICPTNRTDLYGDIKYICCSEIPTPSQVILSRTLLSGSKVRAIVQKIALQINCKVGGSLWNIKIPFKNVMICGIDVYHEKNHRTGATAAFVASLNRDYTKWYSKAISQTRKTELVTGLCAVFTAALIAYHQENDRLPDQVIIYRDGVGDGQLNMVCEFEIPQFEYACQNAFPDYNLRLTFIVVQKRINTRFFTMRCDDASDPPPGTVIDTMITRRNMYDFFLVSQSSGNGCAAPTHYIVLRDDFNLAPDILQRLTYKLCFMYFNYAGSIKIPACCLYAHKLAFLVGKYCLPFTSEKLAKKLFYL